MKTKNIKLLNILLILLPFCVIILGTACDEIDCNDEPLIIEIQELGNPSAKYWLQNIDEEKEIVNLIIKNQIDYEKYVTGNETLPAIDFSNYILLAGKKITNYLYFVFSQRVDKVCGHLKYTVTLEGGLLPVISEVYYFAIIERPSPRTKINFNVVYRQH